MSRLWTWMGLLAIVVNSANSEAIYHFPHYSVSKYNTTTVTIPTTYVTQPITNTTTTTLVCSTLTPNITTVTISVLETITSFYPTVIPTTRIVTVTVPTTISTTIPITIPTTIPITIPITIPTTITPPVSYSTFITTVTTSVDDECPTTCSIAAGTVRLFFWPTSNTYTYPSTYVDKKLDYTFTSPSVYLVINTIYGTNSLGRVGPSGTSEVFAVDLNQVSTILPSGQITRQLTLNDLHTDCPQVIAPEVVATTIPDGHCDFSLLAPQTVKDWALPCNACGRFGLFDPPYAIPTLGGGLIETTITTADTETTTFTSTSSPEGGATSTIVTATATSVVTQTTETQVSSSTDDPSTASSLPTSAPTTVPTAAASRVLGSCVAAWLVVGCVAIWL
ncbi:hypothetical protein F5Y14DRAFT_53979 [Nemania sp. NC0429]|nr:hypothetical protein F5Y14DRAFT_53979 [Nemania sp. NC0429]